MKKSYLCILSSKLMIVLWGLFLSFSFISNAQAKREKNLIIEEILNLAEIAFDASQTNEEKFTVVSKKIDTTYRFGFEKRCTNFNNFKTNIKNCNALALAIAQGNYRLTKKFLSVINDVNDPNLYVWVYDQYYHIVNIALDPEIFKCYNADVKKRFKIINLLIHKNIDFDKIVPTFNRVNALFEHSNSEFLNEHIIKLRAYAVLKGAGPKTEYSIFSLENYNDIESCSFANGNNPKIQTTFFAVEDLKNPNSSYFKHILQLGSTYGFNKLHPQMRAAFNKGFKKFTNNVNLILESD
jgi:hypothetical protein